MRTLILHLTNGETAVWETNFGLPSCKGKNLTQDWTWISHKTGWLNDIKIPLTPLFLQCVDGKMINLNHVVWMEEKK